MRRLIILVSIALSIPVVTRTQLSPQLATGRTTLALDQADLSSLRSWDATIDRLRRDEALRVTMVRPDPLLPGRVHERMRQTVGGIEVFGAGLTRQVRNGTTVSIYGTVYQFGEVDLEPALTVEAARARIDGVERALGPVPAQPVLLPAGNGSATLAYRFYVSDPDDPRWVFVNADTGSTEFSLPARYAQSAVGSGSGVLGDTKKVSTTRSGATYYGQDRLRPPAIDTYDARGDLARAKLLMAGGGTSGDLAQDADNTWENPAFVDAHAHMGFTYDYLYRRFNYSGYGNRDALMQALVNPMTPEGCVQAYGTSNYSTYCANAFYYGPPGGPGGAGGVLFGSGLPSDYYDSRLRKRVRNLASAVDIVAHELGHGIVDHSSELIYRDESGALNEAFADIIGFGVEAFMADMGVGKADWLIGEDAMPAYPAGLDGLRSMADPAAYGDPDHYTGRVYLGSSYDAGGVHYNSSIATHAFYLAVEGGANRTSGLPVSGVGLANREQVEKSFFRAFVFLLPPDATMFDARQATIQSAGELYGADSPAARAVAAAWDAVGVVRGANLAVTFAPDPVWPAAAGRCPQAAPNFAFTVTVQETAGIAFTVNRTRIEYYNAQKGPLGGADFDFTQFFDDCSPASSRIAANGRACSNICVYLGGASAGYVTFTFTGVDDRGTRLAFGSPFLRLGTPTVAGAPPTGAPGACTIDGWK